MNKIFAIVGMCGVGKSVACEYLVKKGYDKVYFGGVTMDELKKEGLAITPENEKNKREELRKKYGMGAYAIKLLPKIKELVKKNNVVLDGLYSWDELKILQKEFGNSIITIAITADKELRYDRLSKREVRPLTKEEAIKRDNAEIKNIAKAGPIAYADYYIDNNNYINNIVIRIDEILKKIKCEVDE